LDLLYTFREGTCTLDPSNKKVKLLIVTPRMILVQ
jgi:hypothetical protein